MSSWGLSLVERLLSSHKWGTLEVVALYPHRRQKACLTDLWLVVQLSSLAGVQDRLVLGNQSLMRPLLNQSANMEGLGMKVNRVSGDSICLLSINLDFYAPPSQILHSSWSRVVPMVWVSWGWVSDHVVLEVWLTFNRQSFMRFWITRHVKILI